MKNSRLIFLLTLLLGLSLSTYGTKMNEGDKSPSESKSCSNKDRSTCTQCKKCTEGQVVAVNGGCAIGNTPNDTCDDVEASYVNSISKSYISTVHDSSFVQKNGGCGPCGGDALISGMYQVSLARNYVSRRAYRVWDFGLGQASNFDIRLTMSEESDGSLTIYQEVPSADFAPMYLDGRRGDIRDGIFHGSQQNATVEIHLLDGQGAVVQNYSDAVTARYIDFTFNTFDYEVIHMGGNEYAGRLLSYKNLNGYGYTITYKTFTQAQIDAAPALQWQKDTVSDSTGRSMSFSYNPTSLGGEYVISSVTLPNGQSITYEYTDTYLSKVTYPDNSFSTYSYSTDADGDTVFHVYETNGKVKRVYMGSNSLLKSSHNGQVLWNQNSMGAGTVVVNDEVTFAYFQHPTTANFSNVYTGEGQMKFRHIDRQARFFTDFTLGTDENGEITYDTITGSKESKFMSRNYTGPNGIEYPSSVTDKYGDNCKYHYDSLNRLVFKSYSDDTFEAWSHNSLNLVTRHRDRLGRVNLKTYDSKGNLLTTEVGLLDSYTGGASNYNHKYWTSGNLAQIIGAVASQSSNNNASKAIDTNTNGQYNMYSVTATANELQPWWKVQLVRSSLVNEVKIYNRKEVPQRLADFTVKLFDGATEVYSETFIDPVESEGIVTVTPPAGTYADSVQLQLNGTNVLSIAEVEVYGSDSVVDAELPSSDNATEGHATYTKEYYPTGHANQHLLRYDFDANNNRTEFIYDANHNLIQINEPDDIGTGYHAQSILTYDAYNRLSSSTDAEGRTTSFEYDERERLVKTTYNDSSTELIIFGSGNTADLIVKKKDRNGNVTKLEYDGMARVTKKIVAYSTMNTDGSGEVVNSSNLQSVTVSTYLDGQRVPKTVTLNGEVTEYVYDYRLRVIDTITHPDVNSTLITSKEYKDNKLFKTTDPYGRRQYFNYRSADSALIRTIQETVAGTLNLTSYNNVKNQNRDLGNNSNYLISDFEYDKEKQQTALVDPRNIRHENTYDSRGRKTISISAVGSLDQTTETEYDANSNVIAVKNPRHFSEGINDIISMAYTRRNLLASRTVASGSLTIEETEYFTYYDDRRLEDYTDFRGNTSTTIWHQCCGRLQAKIDQAEHKQISNNDYFSNVTHTAVVDAVGIITDYHNLPDNDTVQEVTTRYDSRHRPTARTVWLTPLPYVDPNAVPIVAGENGAPEDAEGLTTRYEYFDETTGHPKLAPLLTELANDGITFDANNDGSAVIIINPEGEVSVSIQDGLGRIIASGMYDKVDWAEDIYTLVTWSTTTQDTVVNNLLETKTASALGFENKVQSDGAGRRIAVIDAAGNTSSFEFDANSNLVKSRDANGVGLDCVFDDLNRDISCTDTGGDTTSKEYDLNNNTIKLIDSKSKETTCVYDERNRKESCTDRIIGTIGYTYDANNNLETLTDALGKVTTHVNDDRNLQTQVTFADAGVTSCSYDALRRKDIATDQLGDTVTYNYDLASRLLTREYHTSGTTLESTDTFTFDAASRVLTANKGRYNNTVTITFDEIGRKKTEAMTVGGNTYTLTHTFDADNRVTNCAYPAGNNIAKTWTDRNQLASVNFNAASIADFTYDAGMRESTRTFGNGLVTTMSHNLDNTKSGISVAGKADLSFNYTYDANKNVTAETSTGSVMDLYDWSASFDDIDRVTSWDRTDAANPDSQNWTLDKIGNWSNTTGSLSGSAFNENRTHNDVHELTDIAGSSITYDDKGNMTTDANGNALVWDIDNHLTSFNSVTFKYDALGRRLEKDGGTTSTLFICDGQRVIEEYEDSGSGYNLERSYTYATYIDDILAKVEDNSGSPEKHFYHSDRQFNVRGLTDSIGAIQELYTYSVYGKQTVMDAAGTDIGATAEDNNYGFTGRYLDEETGLWYFRARYFSDEMGRFTSRDPLGYVDGMSLYNGYFAMLFNLDPLGLLKWDVQPKDTTKEMMEKGIWGWIEENFTTGIEDANIIVAGNSRRGTINIKKDPTIKLPDEPKKEWDSTKKCCWIVKPFEYKLTLIKYTSKEGFHYNKFKITGPAAQVIEDHEAKRVRFYKAILGPPIEELEALINAIPLQKAPTKEACFKKLDALIVGAKKQKEKDLKDALRNLALGMAYIGLHRRLISPLNVNTRNGITHVSTITRSGGAEEDIDITPSSSGDGYDWTRD